LLFAASREDDRRQQNYSSLLEWGLSSIITGSTAGSHPPTSSFCALACTAFSLLLNQQRSCSHAVHREGVTQIKTNSAKNKGWVSPGPVLHRDCRKTGAGSARVGMRASSPSYGGCATGELPHPKHRREG